MNWYQAIKITILSGIFFLIGISLGHASDSSHIVEGPIQNYNDLEKFVTWYQENEKWGLTVQYLGWRVESCDGWELFKSHYHDSRVSNVSLGVVTAERKKHRLGSRLSNYQQVIYKIGFASNTMKLVMNNPVSYSEDPPHPCYLGSDDND
ncbi:MAG TPA: hypothetical protein VEL47_07280 [Myxococcota bacterium]|nr:hypothetical protein [Myxococcota bacterium]